MSKDISKNSVTTELEIGSNGVSHSTAQGSNLGAGERPASALELSKLVEAQQQTIQALTERLEGLNSKNSVATDSQESSVNRFIDLLEKAFGEKQKAVGPKEPENLNRSTDYDTRNRIDGRSLMEAQQVANAFKKEHTFPISIPKTMAAYIGPSLAITVNGVRVSIPCDGKTYFINETHYLHAKERLAKLDRQVSDTSKDSTVEIEG